MSADSFRMRVRLGALARDIVYQSERYECTQYLELRIGARDFKWDRLFDQRDLIEVLDAITVLFDFLLVQLSTAESYEKSRRDQAARRWRSGVEEILREASVSYRIDKACIVHFAVDEEFENSRAATLAGLKSPRYASARREFEEAFKALRGNPPNGKAGIRGVFIASETVFRLMRPRAPRLGGAEIKTHLKSIVSRTYADETTALRAIEKMADSFIDWTEGAHFYRHAQGEEEPTEPPLEVTLLLISQGSAFLRWLMAVDAAEMARARAAEAAG